jgi:carbonic anhydrase
MRRAWILVPLFVLAACASSGPVVNDPPDPLERLVQGNARFVAGTPAKWSALAERRTEVAQTQHPFAIVLGCADSRVGPEQVFDRTVGDLFVIRVAGNVVDDDILGSIEYGAEHLHVPLLVVLGHERCGAVTAAVDASKSHADAHGGEAHDHIGSLVHSIAPAVAEAQKEPGDLVDNAVRANVRLVVAQIRKESHVLAELEHEGKLRIVGARYDLDTGEVTILE